MNLIGYWHSEEQTRVGEHERKVYEQKKNFAGKVNKIGKMIAAKGYRSTHQREREHPVWIRRRKRTQCKL